jgi:chemosensory pili system protein ChpA (sensor histidine kinase/response regulator)
VNARLEIDPKTLSWIKAEVAETLDSVRHGLEAFVERNDASQLADCVEHLHKVRGAVEMVEISGAALLAQEMHDAMQALAENRIEMKKEAAELLMRGIIQLPGYLDRLYHGHKDVPIVLLPLLNDLRAVRNKELLTEGAFFFTDLSVNKPSLIDKRAERPTWDLRTIAKKLRPAYLAALLGVFRGLDVEKNLKVLATVIMNLEQASTLPKSEQVWWIGAGLVHALYDAGSDIEVAVKLLLGRIDRQVKRVIDEGEEALERNPPEELLKNLLYYIAKSRSHAPRVLELKKSFGLEQAVPDASAINAASDELIGFNANLMASVSAQIKEEILRIKDDLDVAMHAKKGEPGSLAPVCDRLHTVADTLNMLGMQHLSRLAGDQDGYLRERIARGTELTEKDVMQVAGALLFIESSLYDLNVQNSAEYLQQTRELGATQLPEAEFLELVRLVTTEAIAELAKVKDAVIKYSLDPTQIDRIVESQNSLDVVRGVLTVLGHDRPARIVEATRNYLTVEVLEKKKVPLERALEALANVITAVEYFLESLIEKAVAPEYGLTLAERGLKDLGYPARRASREIARPARDTAVDTAPAAVKPAIVLVESVPELPPQTESGEEVDHELIEVFLAEADDELAAIGSNLDRWKVSADDQESLQMLVRCFHTLKGAGRIIGSTTIGVLAWSVEELLRRVADGRVPSSNRVVDLLDQTLAAMTTLIADIKRGKFTPEASVQPLIDLARDLRQPAHAVSGS